MRPTLTTEIYESESRSGPRRRARARRRETYLALFERSGLSAVAFCREHGICKQTFYNWRHKARLGTEPVADRNSRFAQVAVTPEPSPAVGAIVVQVPGGVTLEAAAGTDAAWLAEVVRALRSS